jgi:hypothetical protein
MKTKPILFINRSLRLSTFWVAASLVCLAVLSSTSSACAALIETGASQQSATDFTPTWSVATSADGNLIAGAMPTAAEGNFSPEGAGGRGPVALTDGSIGPVVVGSEAYEAPFAAAGSNLGAGTFVRYSLGNAANGYDLTNITVFSGWANGGRTAQAYTVYYATAANPTYFTALTNVAYDPFSGNNPGNPVSLQVIISDSAGGVIATNVVAVEFDFTTPLAPNGENGYTGYSEISIQGSPSVNSVSSNISITEADQSGADPFTPTWTAESPNLLAGQEPSSTVGNFTVDPGVLTDGTIGTSGNDSQFATCGYGAGQTLVYSLTNSPNGSDITNIVTYSGWDNDGRDGQYYTISYSTVSSPLIYIPITTVYYLPTVPGGNAPANRVAITTPTGVALAKNVANLKFDFFNNVPGSQDFNNSWQGYSEVVVQGTNSAPSALPPSPLLTQDILPTYAETVAGDQIVFTAAYSNSPPANLQWQQIVGGVTNNVNVGVVNVTNNGAITSTLTLNNVQISNSGSYRLQAVNATNSLGVFYTTAAPLVVGNTPAAVNNVIVDYAGQTAATTNFYPAWVVNTASDLIFGFQTDNSGNPGTAAAGNGNFGQITGTSADPTILADGTPGIQLSQLSTCGSAYSPGPDGQSMTYTLNAQTYGYDLTNITVYGGWVDSSQNEQAYQILYSTVSSPNTFAVLATVDYNPNDPSSGPSSARTTLIPASGVLVHNVHSVMINWNLGFGIPKNNQFSGYSEITVGGKPSTGLVPALTQDVNPLTAEDVQGGSLTMTAAFSGATSYQWQKNGTNIPGATSPTLTLNNLQLSDTATNGGYSLVASNSVGANITRQCAVIVDPVPTAVSNIIKAFAYQTSDLPTGWGPTWDTSALSSSLIAGQSPIDSEGNFVQGAGAGGDYCGGLPVLTDGNYGTFTGGTDHPAFAAGGPNAGQYVIYSLGASPNGYSITNIQVAGGWDNDGRNSQYFSVYYSKVGSPTIFQPLVNVNNSPVFSHQSLIRTTLTPAVGVLVSNVAEVCIDFTTPLGDPNGYSGYDEVSIFGSPTASTAPASPIAITAANQATSTPTWAVETNSLIAGTTPGVTTGNFAAEGGLGGLSVLTDGIFGPFSSGYVTAGTSAGNTLVYSSSTGWNITNIVVYSGWANYARDGQFYNVSYSTLASPNTFIPLTAVMYNPPDLSSASANRVDIAPANGANYLATNVSAVKFDFTLQGGQDHAYSGYTEIVLQGTNLPAAIVPTLPTAFAQPKVSGGNLILSGSGGTPAGYSYTWLQTTNLTAPIVWTTNTSGFLDGAGAFSNNIPIGTNKAAFFRFRMP